MHELAIVESVIDACAERSGGARVTRVVLEIGKLSCVMPDAVRFCFELATEGTPLDRAFGRCPCGSTDLRISRSSIRTCSARAKSCCSTSSICSRTYTSMSSASPPMRARSIPGCGCCVSRRPAGWGRTNSTAGCGSSGQIQVQGERLIERLKRFALKLPCLRHNPGAVIGHDHRSVGHSRLVQR